MFSISDIIGLFHKEKAIGYKVEEIRLEEDDSRWVLFVDFPKNQFVIKIAANDFTTKERINGWVEIINAYRSLGYYSPALIKSRAGNYAEEIIFHAKPCVVWEEEYAKYHLFGSLDKSVYTGRDGRYVFHNEVLAFLGRVAGKHYDFFPYKSGWVRLEPFGANETTDEVTQCVKTFDSLVKEKAPHYVLRWEKIYSLFEENKKQLMGMYSTLPTSIFQSDHFQSNLLLDEEGHFRGVIDYNLAGADTVINVFLYTVLFGYGYHYGNLQVDESIMLPEYNSVAQDFMMQSIRDTLKYLRQFYTFNEEEAQAVLPLYKYVSCIEYRQIEAFKKYQNDNKKLNLLFDAMESELLREENHFHDVMFKI